MTPFRILHVEDDIDCNFLMTEALRKEKHITVDWAANKGATRKLLDEYDYDLIVCDGFIPGWDTHLEDVIDWACGIRMCIYSAKKETELEPITLRSGETIHPRASFAVFSKSSEGTHNLVRYIKTRSFMKGEGDESSK